MQWEPVASNVMEVYAEVVGLTEETLSLPWVVREGCLQEVAPCGSLKSDRELVPA